MEKKGNPFSVVFGSAIFLLLDIQKNQIANETGTPETIFINSLNYNSENNGQNIYELNLTVKTPIGKELGTCAHGFTGAIQILLDSNRISVPTTISVETTLGTKAVVYITKDKIISLEFKLQEVIALFVDSKAINHIFGVEAMAKDSGMFIVASVGSPKLMFEVRNEAFMEIQRSLTHLNYDLLLSFQNTHKINGSHVFTRNKKTGLSESVIQVNAFLRKENVIDAATGVSNAAQFAADDTIKTGQELMGNSIQ